MVADEHRHRGRRHRRAPVPGGRAGAGVSPSGSGHDDPLRGNDAGDREQGPAARGVRIADDHGPAGDGGRVVQGPGRTLGPARRGPTVHCDPAGAPRRSRHRHRRIHEPAGAGGGLAAAVPPRDPGAERLSRHGQSGPRPPGRSRVPGVRVGGPALSARQGARGGHAHSAGVRRVGPSGAGRSAAGRIGST